MRRSPLAKLLEPEPWPEEDETVACPTCAALITNNRLAMDRHHRWHQSIEAVQPRKASGGARCRCGHAEADHNIYGGRKYSEVLAEDCCRLALCGCTAYQPAEACPG